MRNQKISVIGCGWFGLPLSKSLIQKGCKVKGSTTSINKLKVLEDAGLEPYILILNPDIRTEDIDKLVDSDILVLNIPPKRGMDNLVEFHTLQIKFLMEAVERSPVKKVVFISSTSVYGNTNSVVTEETELNPERESGKALVEAERILKENINFETTIVRFGGLIGPDRNPARFMAGRKDIKGGDDPVNLIHLDDCIGITEKIIENEIWDETFNACAEEHPSKNEMYTFAAKKEGLPLPSFQEGNSSYKIVSPEKLKRKLNYTFKFPDPLKMF